MDAELREKIGGLASDFENTPAKRNSSARNPYISLAEALEHSARPQDTPVLSAVLDNIVRHNYKDEVRQGATQGNAILTLTQFVNQGVVKDLIDTYSTEAAEKILSEITIKKAEEMVRQYQIDRLKQYDNQMGL